MNAMENPVKHGVRVYGTNATTTWYVKVSSRDANWNLNDSTTWQVRRSEFDKMMLDEAVARGAKLMHGTAIKALQDEKKGLVGAARALAGWQRGRYFDQGRAGLLRSVNFPRQPKGHRAQIHGQLRQAGCFLHPCERSRFVAAGTTGVEAKDNTLIFYDKKFHWAWFIPIDKDIVSLGMVTPRAKFLEKKQTPEEYFRSEVYNINPEIGRRVPKLDLAEKVHVIPNYSYQVRGFCGKGFICLGDSHRFIDPIFSFGVTVTMREGEFAAPIVQQYLEGKLDDKENPFEELQMAFEKGIDNLEDMIDLFWEQPFAFATFVHSALHRPDDGRFCRPHLRVRASAVAFDHGIPQTAQADPRIRCGRLFRSDRLALSSGARPAVGAGFTGRRNRGVDWTRPGLGTCR